MMNGFESRNTRGEYNSQNSVGDVEYILVAVPNCPNFFFRRIKVVF
jgi:hypothetical protein